jgi:hypothetical protein
MRREPAKNVTDFTLQELDGEDWGEPTYPSTLVTECHRLRRVPLREFTPTDLRRLIGQKLSLEYLIPLALERLSENPWLGDYYEGDLLHAMLELSDVYWQTHPELKHEMDRIVTIVLQQFEQAMDDSIFDFGTVDLLRKWKRSA